jgi:hypothetical protein
MPLNRNDLIMIRQYLLAQLAEDQEQVLEQRLLTEDDLFEELEVTEAELFDEYVADELTPADRKQFEEYFLATPERREELKFASGLRRYVTKKTIRDDVIARSVPVPPLKRMEWIGQSQLFRIAAIVSVVVVIAGVLWFTRISRPPTSYASFSLTISNNNRADSVPITEINLPLKAEAVRFSLKLPEAFDQGPRFRAELLKDSGETIRIERVALVDQAAVIELPAAQLSRGQYALKLYVGKLDGTEQRINGSYFFSVK